MKEMVHIRLENGGEKKCPKGTKVSDIINDNNVIAALLDGKPVDLNYAIEKDASLKPITFNDEEGKRIYWHSTSHIMAQAVKELFPDAKLAIGPATQDGFYYDFDRQQPFTPEDLKKIEERMKKIIKADLPFKREEINKADAIKYFKEKGEKYKLEILSELNGKVSIYRQGDFVDLCSGPHIPSTGRIKVFKLLSVAGAYWRGDEHREQLQRIYGISYENNEDLEKYLKKIDEAKERDHRKLGAQLSLYSIEEDIGPGLVLWYPKGAILLKIIEDFWWDEHRKRGYDFVSTPHIAKANLWNISGHTKYYKDMMYPPMEAENIEYLLKPMNCPFHIQIYKSVTRSYRDLPIRLAELGTVYRYERSGVLHGLLRVRGFTQDDAHIFCTPAQIEDELVGVIELARSMLGTFGFKSYSVELSVRDPHDKENYMGSNEEWEQAEHALIRALDRTGLDYKRVEGEAVFYGPKIDIKILDVLGRAWQATTIQFDFNLPKRHEVNYMGEDGEYHEVVMIHRAILGSIERFVGTLLEYYKGALPVWLSPIQVKVATIAETYKDYAKRIADKLGSEGLRVSLDTRDEKIGFKIREASINKIPYIIVVGEKEASNETISLRERGKGELGSFKLTEFLALVKKRIKDKT
ncbi:MAG TPA: threonine--tRNA ligase [bacterium (Candidatus Stahlbacteria)]|nr:threonine--tRNA ligase [Candidatus Stahlbacteria bacterium]